MDRALWKRRFREHLELAARAPTTVKTYLFLIGEFLEFLDQLGLTSLASLQREHLDDYRCRLLEKPRKGRPITRRYLSQHLCAVKAFTRFLARERYLLFDPGREVDMPRTGGPRPLKILSEAELERILDAPDVTTTLGLRDRAILEVLYSAALRNSELRALKVVEVDLARELVEVRRGKGGKSRVVPIGSEAAHWLAEYLMVARPRLARELNDPHLFLTVRGGPICLYHLVHLVAQSAERAGLERRVTPHLLRHCCATHMLRRGAGIRHLQELLGHATPESTQRYTKVDITDLKRVHRRCHPRERS